MNGSLNFRSLFVQDIGSEFGTNAGDPKKANAGKDTDGDARVASLHSTLASSIRMDQKKEQQQQQQQRHPSLQRKYSRLWYDDEEEDEDAPLSF